VDSISAGWNTIDPRVLLGTDSQMISLLSSEKEILRNRDHEEPYDDKFGVKLDSFIKREQ